MRPCQSALCVTSPHPNSNNHNGRSLTNCLDALFWFGNCDGTQYSIKQPQWQVADRLFGCIVWVWKLRRHAVFDLTRPHHAERDGYIAYFSRRRCAAATSFLSLV